MRGSGRNSPPGTTRARRARNLRLYLIVLSSFFFGVISSFLVSVIFDSSLRHKQKSNDIRTHNLVHIQRDYGNDLSVDEYTEIEPMEITTVTTYAPKKDTPHLMLIYIGKKMQAFALLHLRIALHVYNDRNIYFVSTTHFLEHPRIINLYPDFRRVLEYFDCVEEFKIMLEKPWDDIDLHVRQELIDIIRMYYQLTLNCMYFDMDFLLPNRIEDIDWISKKCETHRHKTDFPFGLYLHNSALNIIDPVFRKEIKEKLCSYSQLKGVFGRMGAVMLTEIYYGNADIKTKTICDTIHGFDMYNDFYITKSKVEKDKDFILQNIEIIHTHFSNMVYENVKDSKYEVLYEHFLNMSLPDVNYYERNLDMETNLGRGRRTYWWERYVVITQRGISYLRTIVLGK